MELIDEIVADKAAGTRRLVAEYGGRLHEVKNLVRAKIARTVQPEGSSNGKEE